MAKILIFTSHGGGGHISASQALNEHLGKQHDVKIIPFFIDVLDRMDPIKFITFKNYHVEDIYNYCLRRKWARALNAMYYTSQYGMPLLKPIITKLLFRFIAQSEKPDLIISVIPLVNQSILKVAEKLDIPFLLIPTDLDSSTFLFGIRDPKYDRFAISLPYNHESIKNKIVKSRISDRQITISGFPIRESFWQPKNKQQIKKDFNISSDWPVVLLMMGAEGSTAMLLYLKQLIKLNTSCHLFIVLGRNIAIKSDIEKLVWPSHINYQVIGFTDRIADLMAIADICITKSGSVSVSECIYMKLPMLLDGTGTSLLWEQFNLDFIKENKLGDVVHKADTISLLLEHYLSNNVVRQQFIDHLNSFCPPHFSTNITKVIEQLIS